MEQVEELQTENAQLQKGMQQGFALNTGANMPSVGLGTWQAGPGEVGAAVRAALDAGYRHIDCAACYGNEAEVGAVFKEVFGSGLIQREDVFITSKLWNSEHKPENVKAACLQTLEDLGLGYLDMYPIHWPQNFEKVPGTHKGFPRNADGSMRYDLETTTMQTWGAMEALVEEGLTKAIGLSNFNSKQIEEVYSASRVKPANLQVEIHPYFQNTKLVDFALAKGILVTAYSPLGSGGADPDGNIIPTHPTLKDIGAKYQKSAAQTALAYTRQRGIIVIPKSVTASRIQQNLDVTWTLSDEDMKTIAAMDLKLRMGWGGPKVERNGEMRPRDEANPYYPFRDGIEF